MIEECVKFPENCAVCGDQATGYHYEVASCNGCKTFFRRTLIANRKYKCHKSGNCVFNKDLRCSCRACRFSKCVAVGMNPKAIQCNRLNGSPTISPTTTDQPIDPGASIGDNKLCDGSAGSQSSQMSHGKRRRGAPDGGDNVAKRSYTISALLNKSTKSEGEIDELVTTDENLRQTQSSATISIANLPPSKNCVAARKCQGFEQKYDKLISQLVKIHQNVGNLMKSDFDVGDSILDVLARPPALKATGSTACDDFKSERLIDRDSGLAGEIDVKIAIAIEYAKSFELFQWMPLRDKILLLRDVIFVLLLLDSAYESTSKPIHPLASSNECINDGDSLYSSIGMINESLKRARLDTQEFVMLKAVAFMHAECFGLSAGTCSELTERRQAVLDSLFDYMMTRNGKQAPVRYGNALSVLWTLYKGTNAYVDNLQQLELRPLSAEMMGTKLPEKLI